MAKSKQLNWTIDAKYKAALTANDAKFIIDEAEKAFNDTIETSAKLIDRTSTLLSLVSGLIIGLVAYAIGKWEKSDSFDSLLITAIVGVCYYLCLGLVLLFPNIKPNIYVLPGTQPKKLFLDAVFNLPEPDREKLLYITKITNLQNAIDTNRAINDTRWNYYKWSLNFLFYSPALLIVVYLLINLTGK